MWRNADVLDFVGWLREHNDRLGGDDRAKAGFYGSTSTASTRRSQAVLAYLDRVDPAAARACPGALRLLRSLQRRRRPGVRLRSGLRRG